MGLRIYVHGDLNDNDAVYCARCDLFVDEKHFYPDLHNGPHDSDFDCYLRGLKTYNRAKIEDPCSQQFRPSDARNIFSRWKRQS
jgi:hypothetical protein